MNIGIDALIIANKSFIDGFILKCPYTIDVHKKGKHEVSLRNVFLGLAKKRFRHIRKGLSIISPKKI
jgi:hypothetical protein